MSASGDIRDIESPAPQSRSLYTDPSFLLPKHTHPPERNRHQGEVLVTTQFLQLPSCNLSRGHPRAYAIRWGL